MLPPETNDAAGTVAAGADVQLTTLNGTPLTPGSDPDGTVVSYTVDLSTLPDAADGVLFLGDPAGGGTPIAGANNTGITE